MEANLPAIDEELFISERCIHTTLSVFILLDDVERKAAIDAMQDCRQYLADLKTPFQINIKGLEIMNDDPSSTRVLYALVESPELQQFADKVLKHFQPTGLAGNSELEKEQVKLHMTVMNTRYRRENSNSFDAREILKRYGDYDFGSVECNEVHLCVLRSSNEVDDFYKISSSLKF